MAALRRDNLGGHVLAGDAVDRHGVQWLEIWPGQVAGDFGHGARSHLVPLHRRELVDHRAQREPISVAPIGLGGLWVLAERDLGQHLPSGDARLFGAEHVTGAEQHPAAAASAAILRDPRAAHLAAGALAQPVTKTGEFVVELDYVGLPGGRVRAATDLAVMRMDCAPLWEAVGKQETLPGGSSWHCPKR